MILDSSKLEARLWVTACHGNPDILDRVPLQVDDFASLKAAAAWKAAKSLHEAGESVGIYAIEAWLKKHGEDVDLEYLQVQSSEIVAISKFEVDQLVQIHGLRRVRLHAQKLQAATEARDASEVSRLLSQLDGVHEAPTEKKSTRIRDAALQAVKEIFEDATTNRRVPFGIDGLTHSLGGLKGGHMVVIGADTSVGKSSVSLAMALGAAAQSFRVGIVSCEDDPSLYGERAAAKWADVSATMTHLGTEDYGALAGLHDTCPDPDVFIESCVGETELDVCSAIRRLVRRDGAQMVVVDYVQAIISSTPEAARTEQVRVMAAKIKGQCARLGVPVILVSQLKRRGKDQEQTEPSKHDLKETGDLENGAEVVLLLWLPNANHKHVINCKVAKSKWGCGKDVIELVRDPSGFVREATVYDRINES